MKTYKYLGYSYVYQGFNIRYFKVYLSTLQAICHLIIINIEIFILFEWIGCMQGSEFFHSKLWVKELDFHLLIPLLRCNSF